MKRFAFVSAVGLLLSVGLFGCPNTEKGAAEDTSANGQKAASVANDAANATKNAADNAADATKKAATDAADATKMAADKTVDATKKAADATVDATKKAADATGAAAKTAVDATTTAAKDAGKTVTAATEVTPKVKLAIVADKDLNNPANHININTKDGICHITGHVTSNSLKAKAGTIVTKALADLNATDKASNELTVSP